MRTHASHSFRIYSMDWMYVKFWVPRMWTPQWHTTSFFFTKADTLWILISETDFIHPLSYFLPQCSNSGHYTGAHISSVHTCARREWIMAVSLTAIPLLILLLVGAVDAKRQDLTHLIDDHLIHWQGHKKFQYTEWKANNWTIEISPDNFTVWWVLLFK